MVERHHADPRNLVRDGGRLRGVDARRRAALQCDEPASVQSAVLRLEVDRQEYRELATPMPLVLYAANGRLWPRDLTWDALTFRGFWYNTGFVGAAGEFFQLRVHPPPGVNDDVSVYDQWRYDAIAKTFLNYHPTGMAVAGHVTPPTDPIPGADPAWGTQLVDVAAAVRAAPAFGDGSVSFLLVRAVRHNAEAASGGNRVPPDRVGYDNLCFHPATSNSETARPQLLLQRS